MHLWGVHARLAPVVARPQGPPSERGKPSPVRMLVAARAVPRASGHLSYIAVTSSSTGWTSLSLLLAARWELRRWMRIGFFRDFVFLALVIPASTISVVILIVVAWPVVLPPSLVWQVDGASPSSRAEMRAAGSGLAAAIRFAGPFTPAVMAIFTSA